MEREHKRGGGVQELAEKYERGDFFVRKLQILAFTPFFLALFAFKFPLIEKKSLFFSKTDPDLINKEKKIPKR